MIKNHKNLILYTIYFILLSIYSVWTYSLTDPNLVLTSWPPYWNFQQWMWQTFFHNSQLLAISFTLIISLLIATYLLIIKNIRFSKLNTKYYILYTLLLILPLLISYNALSHDVFNYIFNAKMIVVYHADPHIQTALEFATDDWTRFMHNTHTPAPYGKLWTYISLIPFQLGMLKFTLTWISFRLFSLLAFLASILLITKSKKSSPLYSKLVLLSPLLLIEVVTNIHNDFWMLTPALASFLIMDQKLAKKKIESKDVFLVVVSLLLLIFSIYIKIATTTLLPIWIIFLIAIILKSYTILPIIYEKLIANFWPLTASLALFVPLLTLRSQQFHPWYFSWVMIWIPFFYVKKINKSTNQLNKLLIKFQYIWLCSIIVLSFSSLYRYIPWLYQGEFNSQVLWQQKAITWIPFAIMMLFTSITQLRKPSK